MADRPVIGVGMVVFKGAQVLLVQRARPPRAGQWSLPGGRQEWGETALQAGLRELSEETGVTAEPQGLVDVVDLIDRPAGLHYTLVDYAAHWTAGTPRAADAESLDARFWPLDALVRLSLWDETVRVIQLAWRLFPMPGRI